MRVLGVLVHSLLVVCVPFRSAQAQVRSPLRVDPTERTPEWLGVELEAGAAARLARLARLELRVVPLTPALSVDVDLARIDGARSNLVFYVDGAPAPGLLDGAHLSVWTGSVRGASGSSVLLAFSEVGCRGWIRHAGELFHLVPEEGTRRARWITESVLSSTGASNGFTCDVGASALAPSLLAPPSSFVAASPTTTLLACPIAIETDWQLHQVFGGNLAAQSAYLATMLTWIAHQYEQQVSFVLTFPYVGIYTTPNDPWTTPDLPGTKNQMLTEFYNAWTPGVVPNGARFGAFVSGALLGGGVAYLNVTCLAPRGQSVTGNLHGQTPFPVVQGPLNWDVVAVAHELGHNFSALHTNLYCPPVDECAPPPWGPCQTQQACISTGTIMSYCHLCPGGFNNVEPAFHPFSALAIRHVTELVYGCLPVYAPDPAPYCTAKQNSLGCTPQVSYAGHPTLSGLDNFRVRCEQALNNKPGLMLWSAVSASLPFHGGTKCVASPFSTSAILNSGGAATGSDCSGVYEVGLSHAFMAAQGWLGGAVIYAQFWMRDPASLGTIGLSDGLQFTVAN